MSAPHIAVVVQNALLELDVRPRREAETLAAAGYRVTLIGGTRSAEHVRELVAPGTAVESFKQPGDGRGVIGQIREQGEALARAAAALRRACRRGPVAALHAANPPDNLFLLPPTLRWTQAHVPLFVFDQHDAAPVLLAEKFPQAGALPALSRAARALERRSFEAASLVVFANEEFRARAQRERLPMRDSEVVANGWSLPDVPADLRWRHGVDRLIVYVGLISEQDNVDHLVDAVAALPDRRSLRVVVAGDGSARASASRRALDLGLADTFVWLGAVKDRYRLGSLVNAADVCVAPEIDSQFNRLATFVKIVEYMSLGAAVVAHRMPETERLAGDTIDYAGDMSAAALAAAIHSLVGSPDRARALGAAARDRFDQRVDWRRAGGPRLVAAYDRLFGAPASRAREPDSQRRQRPRARLA
jgi:glycosyltransferase involved in cell wall biosynthesis